MCLLFVMIVPTPNELARTRVTYVMSIRTKLFSIVINALLMVKDW